MQVQQETERRAESSPRMGLTEALRRSKMSRVRRRIAGIDHQLVERKAEVDQLSQQLFTRGRIVRTDEEARAALVLVCRRNDLRRECTTLFAQRQSARCELATLEARN